MGSDKVNPVLYSAFLVLEAGGGVSVCSGHLVTSSRGWNQIPFTYQEGVQD